MKKIVILFALFVALIAGGCSTLQLQPADFSWVTEEILDVTNDGMVAAQRYSVEFNVKPLLAKEFAADSMAAKNTKTVRLIRDKAGFYYVTGPKFKNVYVFAQAEGSLSLSNTIVISPEKAMDDPKFNQRNNYVELINETVNFN
ncbi:MAG: hypothetical protein PHP62_05815 [Candidatus Moranbacteria bacterium]|nr:hypothetical protein [Candidatus Moranbacteria bacterium]